MMIFLAVHMLWGKVSIIPADYNFFCKLAELPVIRNINAWFSITGLPQYLFWYSFGSFAFKYLCQFEELRSRRPIQFHLLGLSGVGLSAILFLIKITDVPGIKDLIYSYTAVYESYRIISTLCICFGVMYLSMLLEQSEILKGVGKNSMSLMGLEYITHSYITLSLLPMLNLGIPNITSTIDVMTITFCTLWMNCRIAKAINKYFPVLNGKWIGPSISKEITLQREEKREKLTYYAKQV